MKEYKVTFQYGGSKKQEIVLSENIFRAQDQVRVKYGKGNVQISSAASTSNRWM